MPSRPDKLCKHCKQLKPVEEFVNANGVHNPRGTKCHTCYTTEIKKTIFELLEGRDRCIYCDAEIPVPPAGKAFSYCLERDHMDPRARGGWDHPDNLIWCCRKCNQRKRDSLFADWLNMIPPVCRENARQAYIKKHCYQPEEFFPLDLGGTWITVSVGLLGKSDRDELEIRCEWYDFTDDENDPGGWERWFATYPI
jgi:hypothetical protein